MGSCVNYLETLFSHTDDLSCWAPTDTFKVMHTSCIHVLLAEVQMLSAMAVCSLTRGLRGKRGKLLISGIIDGRPHSRTSTSLSLTHTHYSSLLLKDVVLNISKVSV